jgi:hypothetical protein
MGGRAQGPQVLLSLLLRPSSAIKAIKAIKAVKARGVVVSITRSSWRPRTLLRSCLGGNRTFFSRCVNWTKFWIIGLCKGSPSFLR